MLRKAFFRISVRALEAISGFAETVSLSRFLRGLARESRFLHRFLREKADGVALKGGVRSGPTAKKEYYLMTQEWRSPGHAHCMEVCARQRKDKRGRERERERERERVREEDVVG